MIRTLILVGAISWYAGPYVGEPLRCGGTYDTTHAWIAIDIDAYPQFRCGDLVQVDAAGVQLLLRIADSGPLSAYQVCDGGECVEIVGDLPAHVWAWPGLSVQGRLVNVTGALRARLERER